MAATNAKIIVLAFCLVFCQLRVFAFEDDAGMKRFEFGPSTENLDTTERICTCTVCQLDRRSCNDY